MAKRRGGRRRRGRLSAAEHRQRVMAARSPRGRLTDRRRQRDLAWGSIDKRNATKFARRSRGRHVRNASPTKRAQIEASRRAKYDFSVKRSRYNAGTYHRYPSFSGPTRNGKAV